MPGEAYFSSLIMVVVSSPYVSVCLHDDGNLVFLVRRTSLKK